jgi:hypothetical protein
MDLKKLKFNQLKYDSYQDAKLCIKFNDTKNNKEYSIHKILFGSCFQFFETLFHFDPNQNYFELQIPFDQELFDILYDKIYNNVIELTKDMNYYENMLYLLSYFQYHDITKFLNKIIKYIEFNTDSSANISSFLSNLQKFDYLEYQTKMDFIHRISYDQFIENYYDENSKRLVLTSHIYNEDRFPNQNIKVNGMTFSLYHTEPYDIQQIGFWIDYRISADSFTSFTPMTGNGEIYLYSGMNKYKHKIQSFKKIKESLHFDSDGQCGYIKEYYNSQYDNEPIDARITFYKMIINFDK